MDSPLILNDITNIEKKYLLNLAMHTMRTASEGGEQSVIEPMSEMSNLHKTACCFVTLIKNDCLRGCIGNLLPTMPLFRDVIKNTLSAMYDDPRFGKVTIDEIDDIQIQLSILSSLKLMPVESEADLLKKITPFVDGIVLQEGSNRGTFLPSVWESLPDPVDFIRHLKQKAGLKSNHWSDKIEIKRYSVLKLEYG